MNILIYLQLFQIVFTQKFYSTLTANNINNICHCDLNTNFCDYNCCCDADCNQVILILPRILSTLLMRNLIVSY